MALQFRRVLLAILLLLLFAAAGGEASAPSIARLDPGRVVRVSWRPRAFLYRGFLSDAECDHLIALAKKGGMEKSMVVDTESGGSVLSDVRTSSGMFLEKRQDEVVARIEDRIAAWTFLPPENGEAIQILRYQNGEKYEPHYDYIHGEHHKAVGGNRDATVLMYLSNVKMGGETIFPEADDLSQPKDDTWSECAKVGNAVKPAKGDALLFFSLHPNTTLDTDSVHGSCPVVEGEKWSATKWIHVGSFDGPRMPRAPDVECKNEHPLCPEWAAAGECVKNPDYMVGTSESPGSCRKSCGVCTM